MMLYSVPALIQGVLIPFWFLKVDARYVDASIISIVICLLTPIYLIIINFIFQGYKYGILRLHLFMLGIVILGVIFSRLGWSRFDFNKFMHPDPLTAGFNKSFIWFGEIGVFISLIVSYIIKLVKRIKK